LKAAADDDDDEEDDEDDIFGAGGLLFGLSLLSSICNRSISILISYKYK
jgi:hypothetical protein